MAGFSGFSSYNSIVNTITHDLKKLREFSQDLKLDGNASAIDVVLKRLADSSFSVAVVGEFKRGKSTLINALLEKDVLPTDVLPCSATLNKIKYDIDKFVEITYKDDSVEKIGIDQLGNYVTKLTKESEERAKTVKEATVHYPVPYCKDGITIIDTPGLNDDEAMTEVTLGVLPHIDAALMVIMAQSPFSKSEADFLESKIIANDVGKVLFVVTGIDTLDESDVDRVLLNITDRIQEYVVTKVKNTYGEDSEAFNAYKRKIGKVRVYGLSAKKALRAKLKNDDEMLKVSRFPVFKEALERFLTEDRGAVTLNVPVNRIKTSSIELANAIQLREYALTLRKDEFNKKYDAAMETIADIKRERKTEFDGINERAVMTKCELKDSIKGYWNELEIETIARNTISDYAIKSFDELKEQATLDKMAAAVQNAISPKIQILAERVQTAIETALGAEAEQISGFEERFYAATARIQSLFTGENAKASGGGVGSAAFSTIGNYFTLGLGSAYNGFKDAGWKGALLGGATGAAGTTGAMVGIGLLIGALSLPATWPVLLIGGLVSGLAGHFTGKWTIGKFLLDGKIENFKDKFKDVVIKEVDKIRNEMESDNILRSSNEMGADNTFFGSVYKQIDMAFDALKDKIRTETDNILGDMQKQLEQIRVDSVKTDVLTEKEREELNKKITVINEICSRADEIGKNLTEALSK